MPYPSAFTAAPQAALPLMRASHRQFDTRALPSIVRRSGLWGWITTAPITLLSCLVQRLPRRFGEPEHSHHQRHGAHRHSVPEAGAGRDGPGEDGLAVEGQEYTELAGAANTRDT